MKVEFRPATKAARKHLLETFQGRSIDVSYDEARNIVSFYDPESRKQSLRQHHVTHQDGAVEELSYADLPVAIIQRDNKAAVEGFFKKMCDRGYTETDSWRQPGPHEFSILVGTAAVRFRWNPAA